MFELDKETQELFEEKQRIELSYKLSEVIEFIQKKFDETKGDTFEEAKKEKCFKLLKEVARKLG